MGSRWRSDGEGLKGLLLEWECLSKGRKQGKEDRVKERKEGRKGVSERGKGTKQARERVGEGREQEEEKEKERRVRKGEGKVKEIKKRFLKILAINKYFRRYLCLT